MGEDASRGQALLVVAFPGCSVLLDCAMKACRHYELELSAGAVVAKPLRRQARFVSRGLRMVLVHKPYLGKMLSHQRPRKEEGGGSGMEDDEALIIIVIIPFSVKLGTFRPQLA